MIMNDIKIMKYCIKCRQKRIDHCIQNLLFKCKNPLDPDVLFQISICPFCLPLLYTVTSCPLAASLVESS